MSDNVRQLNEAKPLPPDAVRQLNEAKSLAADAGHYRQLWLRAEAACDQAMAKCNAVELALIDLTRRRDDRGALWLAIGVLFGILMREVI